jgi:ADP-ribose pyrophosphatase YjhB (NUDIX family)
VLRRMPWIVNVGRILYGFFRPRFSAGVVGVVFNANGDVLLAEHVFHPHTPWGLPGGWIERNEDPATALRREFHEELELDVTTDKVLIVIGEENHIDIAYLCTANGQVGKLSNELLGYRWTSVHELPRIQKFHYRAIMCALDVTVEEKKL